MPAAAVIAEGYSYPTLIPLIRQSLRSGSSVFLRGQPGVGKSSLALELATEHFKMPLIDIRLAQKDPAEIAGVYVPNRETKTLELYAPDWVRACCGEEPKFLFLDELNAAVTKLHQAASYQIIHEHRVGPFIFNPGTVVMAAGNLEDDEALAVPMSSALANRFRHFTMRVDAEAWLKWGAAQGLSPDVLAWIGFGREPKLHHRMSGEYAYPTPRSWADAAKIENLDVPEDQRRALITSCVGVAATTEFFTFLQTYRRVDLAAVIQRGEIPPIDPRRDGGFVYSLAFSVGHYLRTKGLTAVQLPNLYKLFSAPGFTPEFQVCLIKAIENTKAFRMLLESPLFKSIRERLVKFATTTD